MIKTSKTVYEPRETSDGKRILVMSLWPRNVSKDKVDEWLKELGTPKELIKQWKEGQITWKALSSQYVKSLKGKDEILKKLAEESKKRTITLLCSCKDEKECHRSLLKKAIEAFL